MEAPLTRVCTKCGEEKPLEEFVKNPKCKYGRTYECLVCYRERKRESNRNWQKANPEKKRENNRKWHEANREKENERKRKWQKANPEKVRESVHKWQKANREKVNGYHRKYCEANPEKVKDRRRNWQKANSEHVKEYVRKWREDNPEEVTRKYILTYFRRKGIPYNEIPEELIEYKRLQLKLYRKIEQLKTQEHETS